MLLKEGMDDDDGMKIRRLTTNEDELASRFFFLFEGVSEREREEKLTLKGQAGLNS